MLAAHHVTLVLPVEIHMDPTRNRDLIEFQPIGGCVGRKKMLNGISLYFHNYSYRTIKQATTTRQTAVTSGMWNSMSRCYITARATLQKGKKGGKNKTC